MIAVMQLGDPGAAKEDATQVLDALQAGGVPLSPKIVRELIQKALYRCEPSPLRRGFSVLSGAAQS